MIKNLKDYFLPNQEYYLAKIFYQRIDTDTKEEEMTLNCTDNIKVDVDEKTEVVRVTAERILRFEPDYLFELTVSFGVILQFDSDKKGEYDWHDINLAEEFTANGEFALENLMSRISLQIAQITSSYGQAPLIMPSGIVKNSISGE